MKRIAISGLIAVAGVISATAGVAAGSQPPRAGLQGYVCQTAFDPGGRALQIVAVMRPVAGTRHMWLRFELLSRARGASRFSAVSYGDLGTWISPSNPTLGQRPGDRWIYTKQVIDLAAPASYRFQVTFKWAGTHGRVLSEQVLNTRNCFQPELRPDLAVTSVSIQPDPNNAKLDYYAAKLVNRGETAADGPFQVTLTPGGGGTARTRTIQQLGAHRGRQLVWAAPACTSANAPTIVADPGMVVDDYNRANNSLTIPSSCPAVTTATG